MNAIERDLAETLRRAEQIAENIAIGNDAAGVQIPSAEFMTEELLARRCVFVSSGNKVAILPSNPTSGERVLVREVAEFNNMFAASGELVEGRWLSFPMRWMKSRSRLSVDSVMLGIGRDRMMDDAEGHAALNLWTPRFRKKPSAV